MPFPVIGTVTFPHSPSTVSYVKNHENCDLCFVQADLFSGHDRSEQSEAVKVELGFALRPRSLRSRSVTNECLEPTNSLRLYHRPKTFIQNSPPTPVVRVDV